MGLTDMKLCGECKYFLGGGDFALCCSKKYDLCYALDSAEDCEHYEYDATKDWVCECPYCGEMTTYYYRFSKNNPYNMQTDTGKPLKVERFWRCQECEKTVKILLSDTDGNKYIWKAKDGD